MSVESSQFGRAGRSDRRRRLLVEDRTAGGTTAAAAAPLLKIASGNARKASHYGEAAFLENQFGLTDLIPKHILSTVLLLVIGAAVILGIELLYRFMPQWAFGQPDGRLPALDLAGEGNLGTWFSSLVLLGSSIAALAVYSIRRHRVDDYQGRYRIWLWAAAALLLMASDVAANLHETLARFLPRLTEAKIVGNGAVLWLGPAMLVLGGLGARLLMDMWNCRSSSTMLLLASISYSVAAVATCGWLGQSPEQRVMVLTSAAMVAHLLVWAGLGLYARYVLLDAQGLLPVVEHDTTERPKRKAKKVVEKTAEEPGDLAPTDEAEDEEEEEAVAAPHWTKVTPSSGNAQPVLRRAATPAAPVAAPAASPIAKPVVAAPAVVARPVAQPLESTDDKLSKADRKALKKRLLEDRLKREQKAAGKW